MSRQLSASEQLIFNDLNSKLVLREETNYKKLMLQRNNDHHFMEEPIVYNIEGTDMKLVFGQFGKGYDLNKLKEQFMRMQENTVEEEENVDEKKEENNVEETNVVVESEEGINEENVKIILDQIDVSRESAIRALKECNDDVLEALCKLSTK